MSEFLYVPNEYEDTVSVINATNDLVVATISVGTPTYFGANAATVSPDGKFVYVANELGYVSVIDTATNSLIDTINVGGDPFIVALSPDGTLAYVTQFYGNYVSVIDTASNSIVATVTGLASTYGVSVSPDGTRAYVTTDNGISGTVSVVDTASNSIVATINVGISHPTMVAFTPDGTHAYVSSWSGGTISVIDTTSNSLVSTITVGSLPYSVVISPDGTHAYVANDGGTGGVSVIDTATNMVIDTINVGPSVGLALSHDGSHLYVTHYRSSDTVSVIDTATDMVIDTINVGHVPIYPGVLDIPPPVTESLVSDTGISATDLITSNDALTGSGDPNLLVHFTVDGQPILATATADATGIWSFTPTGLADGKHTILATETDAFGNTGNTSLTFTLDTTAPTDVITSDTLNKHGSSLTITGTSEANSAINIYDGSTLLGSTAPNSNGEWSFTTETLSKATVHDFTSTATDVAGNVGHSGAAIYGTSGDNTIYSTSANDILTGGGGTDTFVFSSAVIGKDVITDFAPSGSNHDILQFDHDIFASAADVLAHATQVGHDVVISHDVTDTVTLVGVNIHQFTGSDFHIV